MESFTGRHKREVCYDGQSHLLLIRNETGPPDVQVLNSDSRSGRGSPGEGGGGGGCQKIRPEGPKFIFDL